jgi:hypothetical protein
MPSLALPFVPSLRLLSSASISAKLSGLWLSGAAHRKTIDNDRVILFSVILLVSVLFDEISIFRTVLRILAL